MSCYQEPSIIRRVNSFPLVLFMATCTTLLLAGMAAADTMTFDDNWGKAGFNLIHQDASGIEIVFSVPRLEVLEMEINGELMQNLLIPGVFLPNDAGAPDLPGTARFIALPEGAWAELEVIETRTETLHHMNISPAFKIPRRDDDSPLKYEKNPDIYNMDSFYPAQMVKMSEIRQMRGVDVVVVGITPFQYNPVTRDLIIYQDIRVRINFYGGTGHFGEDRLRSRWFEPVLRQNLLNYASLPKVNFHPAKGQTDEDNVEYIIIVPDDPDFLAWADTLKRWRNEQGIITGITTLSEIGGNDATLIENYINVAYHTWSIPPVAVLLLSDYQDTGDHYGITSPYFQGQASDNTYADIDGDDLPELNIARITAQDDQHLQVMITKMLDYEREPYTDPGFYQHPLLAGAWETDRWFILNTEILYGYFHDVLGKDPVRQYTILSGTPGSIWSSNVNTYMVVDYFGPHGLGYIPATPEYLTNWSGSTSGINRAINTGAFMAQHCDHGSVQGWASPSYTIANLTGLSNEMYPYIFSDNCSSGQYTYSSPCFAEAIHRMQGGAIGIIAASGTSYSFVADVLVWGFYDGLWPDFDPGYGADPYGEENLRPGFATIHGKYYLDVSSWPYNPGSKAITIHQHHHHGGAFLTLYSEIPQNLTVLHAPEILGGMSQFTVTADDGSLIGLSVDGQWIGAAEGTGAPVIINIDPLTPGQIMKVTVTKANYYRYMSDVYCIPPSGPYVIAQSVDVVDNIGWNPNGQLDYDETAKLTLMVQNIGVEEATDVVVTITTDDPLLTIIDGTENYGNIPACSSATVAEGFEVAASPDTPDDHVFILDVLATSDTLEWESNSAITGHAPVLVVDHLEFDDPTGNNNGWLDPGETADMDVFITNEGSSPGVALAGALTSFDPLLVINTVTGTYGTIEPEATASATFNVTADPSTPQEHLADVQMAMSGDHGFSSDLDFQVMIGNILYDPTGPDSYGYSAYDPFDAPENPVYEWTEICADSGGPGTLVNITQDDTTMYFLLPFTFQFYGADYDTFTIAANGWIGMGRVVGDDYSNSGIPNADGPAPMIAPYWEDLSPQRTNSGRVWQWFDEANHRLIVEYNHIEQWAPTGAFETFQVILFDPEYYQTATNDGRILFLYKDMSTTATTAEGTVGIENQTETIGLQYFYDGAYDIHAHHIENEFAILFTTPTQALDLTVTLTPYNPPIQIPATGGTFDYNIEVANNGAAPAICDVWCSATLPSGSEVITLGPVNVTLSGGFIGDRDRTQAVPAVAPAGNYTYNGYVGVYPSVLYDEDHFPFEKLATGYGPTVNEWLNTGESFDDWFAIGEQAAIPGIYSLDQNYPNPFNPLTTIRFSLPQASHVKLSVYNLQGQMVATLVDGVREARVHEVTWDASKLSSGLYFYRLEAGDFTQTQKMILSK